MGVARTGDTLGGVAQVGIMCGGVVVSLLKVCAVSCKMLWRRLRSCSFVSPKCWAGTLCWSACARLATVAMMALAGVIEGIVIYLCLKKTDAEIWVVRVLVVQTVQHL
jgi:hypothetical protein